MEGPKATTDVELGVVLCRELLGVLDVLEDGECVWEIVKYVQGVSERLLGGPSTGPSLDGPEKEWEYRCNAAVEECAYLRAENESLHMEVKRIQEECDLTRKECDTLQVKCAALNGEGDRLRSELRIANKDGTELRRLLEKEKKKRGTASDSYSNMAKNLDRALAERDQLRNDRSTLVDDVLRMQNLLRVSEEDLKEAREMCCRLYYGNISKDKFETYTVANYPWLKEED